MGEFLGERTEHAARAATVVTDVLRELGRADETTRAASVVVDGPELAAALRQVRPAADHDPASPLSCLLLERDGCRLDVVATNRYWLAWREISVPDLGGGRTPSGTAMRAVLEPAGLGPAVDLLEGAGDVALVLSDGRLSVELPGEPGVEIATRAVAYPAHRLIIADLDEPTARVTVARDELRDALGRAGRVVVDVEVDEGTGALRLTSSERVRLAAAVRGGPARLRLSVPLWARAVEACLGPEVTLDLRGSRHPVTVRSAYQPSFSALVMPTTGADA